MAKKATMKIERSNPTRGRRGASETVAATASVLGIPESECTPRVRDAIATLTSEVDGLRGELKAARERLEAAEKNADQDYLCPLLNRRAFVRALTRRISFVHRYHTPASLIYFDLNNF